MKQDISFGQVLALASVLALLAVVGYSLTVLGAGGICDPTVESCGGGGGSPPPPPPPGGCASSGQSCSTTTCCAGLTCDAVTRICQSATDITPPTTAITSPTSGATVGGMVTVAADASDNDIVTRVELWVINPIIPGGWQQVNTDNSSPYSFQWDTSTLSNGSYALQTRAFDRAGNMGTSANVNVTVFNCGTAGQACSPLVAGACCAPLTCQSAGPSSFTCQTVDNVAPSASITSPSAGAWVNGIEIVQVSVSDNSGVIDRVELFVDGSRYATATVSPFSISWNTTSHANTNAVLQVRAYDPSGNMGTSASVTVRVQNNPPPPVAGGEIDVFGWAWSSQASAGNVGGGGIGWLLLNCYDDPFIGCADPYGVKANKTNGVLFGYAWSPAIGWVNFGPPPDAGTGRYPEDPQRQGKINWADGTLSGWARSVNYGGGWDGWIKLAGSAADGSTYGVKMSLNDGRLSGFAWGADIIGWLNFDTSKTTPRRPGGRIEINPLNP